MKKTALGVLALAGTLSIQLAGAGPGIAGEPRVITKTVATGEAMTAEYDHTNGCIRTTVSVFGSVYTVRGSTAPEKLGFVSVTQDNTCTGTTLINGFGETLTLEMDSPNGLSRGRLKMSMEFTNFADPGNPVNSQLTADMSFRATAEADRTRVKSKSASAGIRFVSSADTKSRPVSSTGTIKLGTQNVVSAGMPAYYGMIASMVSKEKTVARPVK
jgi:hypothetical protein